MLFLLVWWLLDARLRPLAARGARQRARGRRVGRQPAGYKVAAFGLSAAYAGVAGSLLAINVAYVSPSSFPIQLSLYLLVGAVVGFYGSIWGAVLGAAADRVPAGRRRRAPSRRHDAGRPDDVRATGPS